MKQIWMAFWAIMVVLLMSACSGKNTKSTSDTDQTSADSVPADESDIGVNKHTEDYLRVRVDTMYSMYKNPKYDKVGMRIYYGKRVNRDSAYCSMDYNKLLAKAEAIAAEYEEPVLDYDHWSRSQDDNNFVCEEFKISNMTDSTAIVKVMARNCNEPTTITLSMCFERNDWFVDDFLSEDGIGEKVYFKEYIEKATFYQRFSLNDLLCLMQHYAEKAKAQKSGMDFIYHESEQTGDIDVVNNDVYVYGHDFMKSEDQQAESQLSKLSPHAFYFMMSLGASANSYLRFVNEIDANSFFERVCNTKPFTFEGKRIVVNKVAGDKSVRVNEVRNNKSTSTMFEIHSPVFLEDLYELYLEIYM